MIENKFQIILRKTVAHIVLVCAAALCLVPFLIIVSSSFSSESVITVHGYGIFPRDITLNAYKTVMGTSSDLIRAYGVTVVTTIIGTACGVLLTLLTAYPLSRKDYKWRNALNFYFYFTMLFSGGAVPSYILISNYLKLKNTIAVLIIPMMLSVWNVFLLRTYFSKIPSSIHEAAEIDGANQFQILFRIVLPMSVTGVATVLLFIMLAYWNEWYLCLMYITNDKTITLQYYLSSIMSQIDSIIKNQNSTLVASMDTSNLPSETARMAICVLAAGPMLFVFSFFQKYFAKGLNVGSVKG